MKVRPILPRIFRAEAPGLEPLALAFLRVQEYSDGVRFHRKVFSLEEFMADWKARHQVETFTYVERWNGYNVSGAIYGKWLAEARAFGPLLPEESALNERLVEVAGPGPWDACYLFGVCDDEGPGEKALVTEHETSHAFFALDDRYRQKARALVTSLPKEFTLRAEAVLRKKGYHQRVFIDEIQAYLATGDSQDGMLGLRTLRAPVKHLPEGERLAELFRETKRRWGAGN